ncbi:MAG TPA: rhodanese-like domain-containing protein [Thermoanaerobaculia bacterium]|jgi:rhodanese-related sulfurtransferase|nr:rhodanese-like domain-containing protein [Thermoanaerobaculia bacterium]
MREPAHCTVRRRTILLLVLPLILLLPGACSYLRPRDAQRQSYRKLGPPVAYELIRDNPDMLILDLRTPQEYNGETGHLQRAQNIPLERLPYRLLEISSYRPETFLVYCRPDGCGDQAIAVLLSSGFENVILMDGGIDAWIRSGFKTVLPAAAAGQRTQSQTPMRPLKPGEKPRPAPEVETPELPPPPPPPPIRRGSAAF